MNDRELLKLAAKAAGYVVEWREWVTSRLAEFGTIKHTKQSGFWLGGKQWDPLTDDGDALRLAVSLGIDLEWRADGRVAAYRHATSNGYCFTAFESSREDRAAATRRAIVRAAAEIGKEMP